jgi:hypothetical protein
LSILEKISDPEIRLFFQVWHSLYLKANRTPSRSDIDPLALGRVLSKVWLYERLPDGSYISLISGEDVRATWNVSMKGRPLSKIIPLGGHKLVEQRFNYLIDNQCIIHGFNITQTKSHSYAERLFVPLTDKAQETRYVFGVSNYNQIYTTDRERYQEIVKNFQVFSYDPDTLNVKEKLVYE